MKLRNENTGQPRHPSLDPIALLEDEHVLFLDICTAFEHVADRLPDEADFALARSSADSLLRHLTAHYEDESEILFPALRVRVGKDHALSRTLDLLESQRDQDVDILTEILEFLDAGDHARSPSSPSVFGYMLRSYFTSERRQIAWERRIVLPAARTLLTE
ncbi:MAG TPA: hemerythrin domain-containing protein, partial [Hyphomicrobiaceae bacterium]|nr:hemerythrin domain-containing protein [Hyphomicrobiaceae bacterium]